MRVLVIRGPFPALTGPDHRSAAAARGMGYDGGRDGVEMLIAQLLAGCTEPAYADPDRNRNLLGDDSAPVDTDTDTGDSAVTWADVTGTLTLVDFQTREPFEDVELSLADDEWTSAKDGTVSPIVPGGTTSLLSAGHVSLAPMEISLTTDDLTGWTVPIPLAFQTPLETVFSTNGVTWDTAKGVLMVSVLEDTGTEKVALDRTTVTISSTYDTVIASTGNVYIPSNEVGEDGNGLVMFVNVPAGAATIELDTPGSYDCVLFPSTATTDLTATVTAGKATVVTVTCTRG